MTISDRYAVYIDHEKLADHYDFLAEYLDVKGVDFQYIDHDTKIPLIDVLWHRTSKTQMILIANFLTLERLITEETKYNDFSKQVRSGRIKLFIRNGNGQSLATIYENLLVSKYESLLDEEYFTENLNVKQDVLERLKQLPAIVLSEGRPGAKVREYYGEWDWVFMWHHWTTWMDNVHFYHINKDTQVSRNKTFFTTFRVKNSLRGIRKMLSKNLEGNSFDDALIMQTKGPATFDDLQGWYGPKVLKNWDTFPKAMMPSPALYHSTHFELVPETLGEISGDDTFYITEKTLKPIMMKHPFVMIAPHNHLANLKSIGFETFSDHIDESYDSIKDPEARVKAVVDLLKEMDLERCSSLYKATREICEFNQRKLLELHGRSKFDLWNNLEKFFGGIT